MSRREANLIPLIELRVGGAMADVLEFDDNLLFSLSGIAGDVGVNKRKMLRMMDKGGINKIEVVGRHRHRSIGTLMERPSIEDTDAIYINTPDRTYPDNYPVQARSVNTTLIVDTNEISNFITSNRVTHMVEPPHKAWAHNLDNKISSGVISAGAQNIVGSVPLSQKIDCAAQFAISMEAAVPIYDLLQTNVVLTGFVLNAAVQTAFNFRDRRRYHEMREEGDIFRGSLLNGPQLGRSVRLGFEGTFGSLIKPLH